MNNKQNGSWRRRCQFSLRSALVVVTLTALGLAAWCYCFEPYRQQRQVMTLIDDLGGRYASETRGPSWLVKVFGPDYFQALTFADLADCNDPEQYLPAVTRCPWLEVLVMGGETVGDNDAAALRGLTGLKEIEDFLLALGGECGHGERVFTERLHTLCP